MNISKDSWHFKFLNKFTSAGWQIEQNGTTLCNYFWRLIWELLAFGVCSIIAVAFGVAAFGVLVVAPIAAFCFSVTAVLPAAIAGCSIWALTGAAYLSERRRLAQPKAKQVREPGLLRSYLIAKKEKFCPIVKIV